MKDKSSILLKFCWILIAAMPSKTLGQTERDSITLINSYGFLESDKIPTKPKKKFFKKELTEYYQHLLLAVETTQVGRGGLVRAFLSPNVRWATVGIDSISKKEVMLINSSEIVENSDPVTRWKNFAIISHELGHVFDKHVTAPDTSISRKDIELSADHYAGHIPAILGCPDVELISGAFDETGDSSKYYYDRATRKKKIVGSYNNFFSLRKQNWAFVTMANKAEVLVEAPQSSKGDKIVGRILQESDETVVATTAIPEQSALQLSRLEINTTPLEADSLPVRSSKAEGVITLKPTSSFAVVKSKTERNPIVSTGNGSSTDTLRSIVFSAPSDSLPYKALIPIGAKIVADSNYKYADIFKNIVHVIYTSATITPPMNRSSLKYNLLFSLQLSDSTLLITDFLTRVKSVTYVFSRINLATNKRISREMTKPKSVTVVDDLMHRIISDGDVSVDTKIEFIDNTAIYFNTKTNLEL